jgi:small subunit ribosomal protein S6
MPPKAKKTVKKEEVNPEDIELVQYEIMAILDPDVTVDQHDKNFVALKKIVTDLGGTISHEEEWGKREFAYTIKKKTHGYYIVMNLEMDPAQMPELNAQFRITNYLVRNLIIKTPTGYTNLTYDWDAEPEVIEKKKPVVKKAPVAKKEVAPEPEPVKEIPTEEVAEVTEKAEKTEEAEATKEVAEKPAEEKVKGGEKQLEKLDEKLEELLSGDDDLNL